MRLPRFLTAAVLGLAVLPLSAADLATRATAAAGTFLATLTEAQRSSVVFAYSDNAQRGRWANLPGPMAKRLGLKLGALN